MNNHTEANNADSFEIYIFLYLHYVARNQIPGKQYMLCTKLCTELVNLSLTASLKVKKCWNGWLNINVIKIHIMVPNFCTWKL